MYMYIAAVLTLLHVMQSLYISKPVFALYIYSLCCVEMINIPRLISLHYPALHAQLLVLKKLHESVYASATVHMWASLTSI